MINPEITEKIYTALCGVYGTGAMSDGHSAAELAVAAFIYELEDWEKIEQLFAQPCGSSSLADIAELAATGAKHLISRYGISKKTAFNLKVATSNLSIWGYEKAGLNELLSHTRSDKATRDFILLHLHGEAVFPEDERVRRVFSRIMGEECIAGEISESALKALGERTGALKALHSHILALTQKRCAISSPACRRCPLLEFCAKAGEL